jgi:5'-3' exonuclease
MGIPVYFKTCIEDYNNICTPSTENIPLDNLFFDLNCLIHPCCHGETDELVMYNKIFLEMTRIINLIDPKKLIFIAIDGPCPKPKMIQQRLRRYKSAKEKKEWDSNAITPGTDFMNNLENYILKNINIFSKKVIFSSSNEPGEGEHKIFDYIKKYKVDNNIIYGLDADLIMLSLISNCKNIYLYRERTEYNIEDIDSKYIYLNINKLKKDIICNIKPSNYNLTNTSLINDYIFICFFIGNDFIQHTPSINIRYNGLDYLLNIYKNLCNKYNGNFDLIDINKEQIINIKNLTEFIKELSIKEDERIKEILNIRNKQEYKFKKMYNNSKNKEELIEHTPIIFRDKEKQIFREMKYWRTNYYMENIFRKCYSPAYEDILKEKINDMCHNYLQSLYWCINYYLKDNISWRFSYNYLQAPSFLDLYNYIKNIDKIEIKKDNNPYTPMEQLNMVLPNESINLIKDTSIRDNSKFPENAKECYILKRYLWESYPILPNL